MVGREGHLSGCCDLPKKLQPHRWVAGTDEALRSKFQEEMRQVGPAGASCRPPPFLFFCGMAILRAVPYQHLAAGGEGSGGGGQVAIAAGLISIPAASTSRAPAAQLPAMCCLPSAGLQRSAGGAAPAAGSEKGTGAHPGTSLLRRDERTGSVSPALSPCSSGTFPLPPEEEQEARTRGLSGRADA